MPEIVGLEKRVRELMKSHERLIGIMVVDETREGYYAIVVRDWDHPSDDVDADVLAERYAYLTKGDGNDGWVTSGDGEGGNGINRRDELPTGRLAGALARLYVHAQDVQQGEETEPIVGSLIGD